MATQRDVDIENGQNYLQRGGPQRGALYRHYKGGLYLVLGRSLREDDLSDTVHYQCVETGRKWNRPLQEWSGTVHNANFSMQRMRFQFVRQMDIIVLD